ncbi:MAG: DUF6880 family protein [Nakamurella sp.]
MSALADEVLPLIRSRSDLHRWGAANAHGRDMHEGVDKLESAIGTADPAEVYTVTRKALASACTVIARADDSSGIIGDACRRLIALHPQVAAAAKITPAKLVDWMIKFQFEGDVDFFTLDPVAYAPALGEKGIALYRERLAAIAAPLGLQPSDEDRWRSSHSHTWFTLDHNARRMAVLDLDIDEIIRTHARSRKVAAWLTDTAQAFQEIGEVDLAIDWAEQAVEFGHGHQSLAAAELWCRLLEDHRPDDVLPARLRVFRGWPSAATAGALHQAAGATWPEYSGEVMDALTTDPCEVVRFALQTLKEPELAWTLAHSLGLDGDRAWIDLIKVYEKIDPLAVLPAHERLVVGTLVDADARNYRAAAQRLRKMRTLAAKSDRSADVDAFIAELRDIHRRRPRLLQEFDRAGLP